LLLLGEFLDGRRLLANSFPDHCKKMHPEAEHFTLYVKQSLPQFFNTPKTVLDVGSGDINGNNRKLFAPTGTYEGNDMVAGNNVTIVSPTSALTFSDGFFDVIVSTECFEHDPEYVLSLKNIARMCKKDGLFFFTCASTGRQEHGTRRTSVGDSFATKEGIPVWQDYYKNLTHEDIAFLNETFPFSRTYYNSGKKDLYYIGLKGVPPFDLPDYQAPHVKRTT
jgi:SAM-dependent methyltransferase